MHILPLFQFVAFSVLSLYWMINGGKVPDCPMNLTFYKWATEPQYIMCFFAGGWTLVWPIVVPFAVLILANYYFATSSFITPAMKNPDSTSLWYSEDGNFEPWCGSKKLSAFLLTVVDGAIFLAPAMAVYALIPMLM